MCTLNAVTAYKYLLIHNLALALSIVQSYLALIYYFKVILFNLRDFRFGRYTRRKPRNAFGYVNKVVKTET